MKAGDFIAIHTPDGTFVAKMISDDGDTITAECGTLLGNKIYYGIPKDVVTLYLSVSRNCCITKQKCPPSLRTAGESSLSTERVKKGTIAVKTIINHKNHPAAAG